MPKYPVIVNSEEMHHLGWNDHAIGNPIPSKMRTYEELVWWNEGRKSRHVWIEAGRPSPASIRFARAFGRIH